MLAHPMQDSVSPDAARARAVACARRIFYRPRPVVDELIATYAALSDAEYPGRDAVVHACYELRALHWPMLNLLDAADRDRRAFAQAVGAAVEAVRAA